MALDLAKVPHQKGGVLAAMDVLKGNDAARVPMATKRAAA
jgi:alanine-glyoxylate transaminase/serine-glyoxylate transaminase/serine-pyruvate transaminase